MSRIITTAAIIVVVILATTFGYDGTLAKMFERVPAVVTVLIQAILAVSVLIAIVDVELKKRWPKRDKKDL